MYAEHTDLFTVRVKIINNFLGCLAEGTDCDDYAVGIGCAVVIEYMMLTARNLGKLCHCFLNKVRNCLVVVIYALTHLEVHIRIRACTADYRMVRIQSAVTELLNSLMVKKLIEIRVINDLNFLNLM